MWPRSVPVVAGVVCAGAGVAGVDTAGAACGAGAGAVCALAAAATKAKAAKTRNAIKQYDFEYTISSLLYE
jgi:hypothetical protein